MLILFFQETEYLLFIRISMLIVCNSITCFIYSYLKQKKSENSVDNANKVFPNIPNKTKHPNSKNNFVYG